LTLHFPVLDSTVFLTPDLVGLHARNSKFLAPYLKGRVPKISNIVIWIWITAEHVAKSGWVPFVDFPKKDGFPCICIGGHKSRFNAAVVDYIINVNTYQFTTQCKGDIYAPAIRKLHFSIIAELGRAIAVVKVKSMGRNSQFSGIAPSPPKKTIGTIWHNWLRWGREPTCVFPLHRKVIWWWPWKFYFCFSVCLWWCNAL